MFLLSPRFGKLIREYVLMEVKGASSETACLNMFYYPKNTTIGSDTSFFL